MSAKVAEDTGFTLTEILVCEHLRLDGPLTPKEVGERVGLSSGAVTRLLDRLEKRGFTLRAPHPSDRRKVLMHYVEQEAQRVERPLALFERLSQTIAGLEESEKHVVLSFMTEMIGAVEENLD